MACPAPRFEVPTRLAAAALLLLGSGCFRSLRAAEVRTELLAESLAAQRFDVSAEAAANRVTRELRGLDRRCVDDQCRLCQGDFCFELRAEGDGCRVTAQKPILREILRNVWHALDAESLARAGGDLDARAETRLQEEEARFEPRTGMTFGAVLLGLPPGRLGPGARVGVRVWHLMELLSTAALEYTWLIDHPSPHQVGVMLGVELTRWKDENAHRLNAPWASFSMFVVPTVAFGDAVRPGFRAGVGVHLNDWGGFPVFFELGATGATPRGNLEPGAFFALGFGI